MNKNFNAEEAITYVKKNGEDSVSDFNETTLSNREVIFALCREGFVTETLNYASNALYKDISFIREIAKYTVDEEYHKSIVLRKTPSTLQKTQEFKDLIPEEVIQLSKTEMEYQRLMAILPLGTSNKKNRI